MAAVLASDACLSALVEVERIAHAFTTGRLGQYCTLLEKSSWERQTPRLTLAFALTLLPLVSRLGRSGVLAFHRGRRLSRSRSGQRQ
eukprot:6213620-Amphidinium_carterae.1